MKLFRKSKYIHMPESFLGYAVWVLAIVFLVTVFIAVDRNSDSVSDTLYGIFPYFASTFLLVEWFAAKLGE